MIQRTLIPTTIPMARRLARLDPVTRISPALAAAALKAEFLAEDVEAHLSEAMVLVPTYVELAASDRPWLQALGHARDVVAIAVLAGFGAYAWAILS